MMLRAGGGGGGGGGRKVHFCTRILDKPLNNIIILLFCTCTCVGGYHK